MSFARTVALLLPVVLAGVASAAPTDRIIPRVYNPSDITLEGLPKLTKRANSRYSSIVWFGDSWCQYNVSRDPNPKPGFYQGTSANGPVAPQVVSYLQGVPLVDYAVSGAFVLGDGDSVTHQVDSHLSDLQSGRVNFGSGRQLYVFFVGINPLYLTFYFSQAYKSANPPTDPNYLKQNGTDIANTVFQVAAKIENARQGAGQGGYDFLFLTVPKQTLVPNTRQACTDGPGDASVVARRCQIFDNLDLAFAKQITDGATYWNNALKSKNRTAQFLDIYGRWADFHANPQKYGNWKVLNVSCNPNESATYCSNPNDYLYWTEGHPSQSGQYWLGLYINPWIQTQP